MNWFENLHNIKVEITSYCNAACPGCIRNETGGKLIDTLELNHMSLDLWTRIMSEDTKNIRLKEILFDGNVGDFCMHPRAIEFIYPIIENHLETEIHINTNGGARNEQFWSDLGTVLSDVNHRINFAIDGLEDTHHIHRRRTTYEVVTRNMKAFIDAGGRANWVFTAFDHNTHQVKEARKRSVDLGCAWFQLRHSCIPGEELYTKTDNEEYEIGTETIYDLEEFLEKFAEEKWKIFNIGEEVESPCTAYREQQIQIDWKGNLWPCSYIYSTEVAHQLSTSPFHTDPDDPNCINTVEHPRDLINLNKYKLEEILKSQFYTSILPKNIDDKAWEICKIFCL